jgi:methionine sulfoxide reductase heme-binding subunit
MTALPALSAGPSPLWYTTRATGVVALILLTATVVLGVTGVFRLAGPNWPRVITAGLHRNISLLALMFVIVHILTTVLDSFVHITLLNAVIPFSSSYRRLWLGLGAVAFDLLLAVLLTSLIRERLPQRFWRTVHWLSYACWPIALWHGLGTGTDSKLPWLLVLTALCVLAVVVAVWFRLSLAGPGPRLAGRAAIAALVAATLIFAFAGPLQPGWARRAGTPPSLLTGSERVK